MTWANEQGSASRPGVGSTGRARWCRNGGSPSHLVDQKLEEDSKEWGSVLGGEETILRLGLGLDEDGGGGGGWAWGWERDFSVAVLASLPSRREMREKSQRRERRGGESVPFLRNQPPDKLLLVSTAWENDKGTKTPKTPLSLSPVREPVATFPHQIFFLVDEA